MTNRAQLLGDAFSLAKAGGLNYTIAFKLASSLVRETEYEPWYVAAKSFKYISKLLEAEQKTEALENLKVIIGLVVKWTISNKVVKQYKPSKLGGRSLFK